MIDNFNEFKRDFKEWEFYFIQIIKRKKDNPDTPWINWNNHARCIKEYSIGSKEQLDKRKQEMINIAEATNSRIYIHPARRSYDQVARDMCLMIWEHIAKWWHWLSWLYRHACGSNKWAERLWVVDVDSDNKDVFTLASLKKFIQSIKWNAEIKMVLKTINWCHLITTPFDLQKFKEYYPSVDVHKNNPTLLYFKWKHEIYK